jgi:HEPN domain-containing protein
MSPITAEWVAKAEADWVTSNRELRARRAPNYDAACFHAQQAAEKHLKALLQDRGVDFAKTHDLEELLGQVLAMQPLWSDLGPDMATLTQYAVRYRYPGDNATREEARLAVKIAQTVRTRVMAVLGLS